MCCDILQAYVVNIEKYTSFVYCYLLDLHWSRAQSLCSMLSMFREHVYLTAALICNDIRMTCNFICFQKSYSKY